METTRLLLEQCQQRADDLERQLLDTKSRCVSLARELQEYSPQSWQLSDQYKVSRHKTSLEDLPDKLICEIFEYATLLCHPFIRSLLLVCRRFHRIIMSASSLWTRIDLLFPKDLMDCFSPTKEYVVTCLERSRGRLLDITIRFPQYIIAENYTINQVAVEMTPVIGQDASMDLRRTLFDLSWGCTSSLVHKRIALIQTATKALIGSKGEHILRWASLSVTLSEDDWGNFFLGYSEEDPAPELQRLEISNLRFSGEWYQSDDCPPHPMPNCSH